MASNSSRCVAKELPDPAESKRAAPGKGKNTDTFLSDKQTSEEDIPKKDGTKDTAVPIYGANVKNLKSKFESEVPRAFISKDKKLLRSPNDYEDADGLDEGTTLTESNKVVCVQNSNDKDRNYRKTIVRDMVNEEEHTSIRNDNNEEDWIKVQGKTGKRKDVNSESQRANVISKTRAHKTDETVILFGNCFAKEKGYCSTSGIEKEDKIVAIRKKMDPILGSVEMLCKIPSLKKDEKYVGIKFEEPLWGVPFEILHTGEDTKFCMHCGRGGREYAFIPASLLVDTSEENAHLQLLSHNQENNVNEKKLATLKGTKIDHKAEAERHEQFCAEAIKYNQVSRRDTILRGIDGYNNSCYVDSALFALFAFHNYMDHLLNLTNKPKMTKQLSTWNILKYDIISRLRRTGEVEWIHVQRFRIALADLLDEPEYMDKFMDTDEFIRSLFEMVLQAPEFLEYNSKQKDFIFQLFPPIDKSWLANFTGKIPSLELMLEQHFLEQEVKLAKMPDPVFIIKLPVSKGVSAFKKILVESELSMRNLLQSGENLWMSLKAVICLDRHHFTCFVKTGKKFVWIYHDSMSVDEDGSMIKELPIDFGRALKSRIDPAETCIKDQTEGLAWLKFLLRTAYICIYEPIHRKLPNPNLAK